MSSAMIQLVARGNDKIEGAYANCISEDTNVSVWPDLLIY